MEKDDEELKEFLSAGGKSGVWVEPRTRYIRKIQKKRRPWTKIVLTILIIIMLILVFLLLHTYGIIKLA